MATSAEPPSPKETSLTDHAVRPGRLRRWGSRLLGVTLRLGAGLALFVALFYLLDMYGGERVRVPGLPLTVRLPLVEELDIRKALDEDGVAEIWNSRDSTPGLTFPKRQMILRSVPAPQGASPSDWERLSDETVKELMDSSVLTTPRPTQEVAFRRYRKVFRPGLAIEVWDRGLTYGATIRDSLQLAPELGTEEPHDVR